MKNLQDEFERLGRIKGLFTSNKFILFDHLHVKNVIHEAEEKTDLRYEYKDHAPHGLIHDSLQYTLEEH